MPTPQRLLSAALLATTLSSLFAPAAQADVQRPGSLLLFPEYDNRQGQVTLITITNTNGDQFGRIPAGQVRVHLKYVDSETCQISNAFETLTPLDTVTVDSTFHSPNFSRGYMFATAYGVTTGGAITFDHLVGSSIVIDGMTGTTYSMQPIVFQGQTPEGTSTDLDSDGIRDLNGLEYSQMPDQTVIPRFFGQAGGGGMNDSPVRSEVILIGLTGGRSFITTVDFLIFNDNEEAFSGAYSFYCWTKVPLVQMSGATRNSFLKTTNHDPQEILGMPALESGWIRFDGGSASSTAASFSDPAVVAVLVETDMLETADLPFGVGSQNNGDLLPASIFGDTSK